MSVFGIGTLELAVILLVAFVALGPGKTIEVARTIGRVAREARRTFTDIMDAASLSDHDTGARRNPPEPARTADAPGQPPSDPLPMPSHLQENADQPSAPSEDSEPDSPPVQR